MNLIICFFLIILLIRIKVPTGASLLIVSIFLSMLEFGINGQCIEPFWATLSDYSTWRFIITVVLIVTFGEMLSRQGYMERLVNTLSSNLSSDTVSKTAPALIGLLPMPGGAMVSAPIIEELSRQSNISPARKTVTNYWWRHIWEPIWPLYQSVILAAAILEVKIWQVSMMTFPITIASIIAGLIFMSPSFGKVRVESLRADRFLVQVGKSLWPILVIFGLGLILPGGLVTSMVVIYAIFLSLKLTSPGQVFESFKKEFSLDIVALFIGSLALAKVISMGHSAAQLASFFERSVLGPYLAVILMPFVIGLLTGLTSAYVGVGFPIVLSLFDSVGGKSSGTLLAYAGGLMGIMASPVHLCLVLTKKYFGADFRDIYRILIPVILFVLIMVVAVDFIIRLFR